jgi:hypothetical protein
MPRSSSTRSGVPERLRAAIATVITLSLAMLSASDVRAQFDIIERAVSKVEGISIYYLYGSLGSNAVGLTTSGTPGVTRRRGLDGFGVELSISLGAIPGSREPTAESCEVERLEIGDSDTVDVYTETRTVDDRRTTTSVVRTKPRAAFCKPPDLASLRLAVGYSQLRGFGATDPSVDLKGAIAESPAVALYAAFRPEATVSPYVGLRAGRADMHGLRGYDASNTIYDGVSNTLQAGVAAGVSVTFMQVFELVIEPSYLIRRFASVEWRTVSGSSNGMLPPQLPRDLDMSGWQIAIGIDFGIPKS